MEPGVSLRDEQIERLTRYIANPRFLDLSDPGTGKTPPVCAYIYYHWFDRKAKTLWSQPKSLLYKNRKELLRFTDFAPEDVVILERDWDPIPAAGTNMPVMERVKDQQYADQVIIKNPGDWKALEKGDLVSLEMVEGTECTYDFDWIYEITDPGPLADKLPEGFRLRSSALKAIKAELLPSERKKIKAKRHYETRQIVERVIDNIEANRDAKVVLCSFNFMRMHWQRLLEVFPEMDCLAVDEFHMAYGGIDSQNTRSLFGVMKHCNCFIGMTGTLLNGRLDSVYPAIHVIEPRYYVSYAGFRQQHVAYEDDYGNVLSWKNEEKVGQILLKHSIRRTFEEVYGKEDVVFLPDLVEMGPMMREQYNLFHEQAMLELEDGEFLDGSLPGVATIRARQIMAHPETLGICKGEMPGKDERLLVHTQDAIERGEHQLIFSVFVPEQERIASVLENAGRRVAVMNGNTSAKERSAIDAAFTARELDDVVGSPQTMAVGWNWEHVDHVIAATCEYQDVDWLQAYRRASRGTRTKTLRVSIMQYDDSVDQRVLQIIKEKSRLAHKVDPTRPIIDLAA